MNIYKKITVVAFILFLGGMLLYSLIEFIKCLTNL